MSAIEKNYTAWRSAPWGGTDGDVKIIIAGRDLSAAAFLWAFAPSEGAAAVISLEAAAAGVEGVKATYFASYAHPTSGALVPGGATEIVPQIDEATLEALTYSGAAPLALFHQLYITPSGGAQFVERFGSLTIRQGVQN
jgi:hypothetical protein